MKTPMQEVFAQLRASKDSNGFGEAYCVDWLLEMEKEILEKEEEVIMNAYDAGFFDGSIIPYTSDDVDDNYYNKTFKIKER